MPGDAFNSNQWILKKKTKYGEISGEQFFAWGKLGKGTIWNKMSTENFTKFE